MATTSHLEITLLEQSQAQKEITINEALARIDAVLNTGVVDRDLATPPGSPATGDAYIVAASPTGAWSGKAGQVAYYDQIWRFIAPREGLTLWVNDENIHVVHNGAYWQATGGGGGGSSTDFATVVEGRLCLTSNTPVTTSDVTAAGTVYFTPYGGNRIALYSGSAWALFSFSQLSISLASGFTSGKPYDVFAYDNLGNVALETVAWTNDTTRATALVFQDGAYVKSGATTRRYLGTFYTTSATTTEDSRAKRFVWNYYNRQIRPMKMTEAAASWSYSTGAWRAANGNNANRVEFVRGVSEDGVTMSLSASVMSSTATFRQTAIGFGEDTTTTVTGRYTQDCSNNSATRSLHAFYDEMPSAGKHYLSWNEFGAAIDTQTWYSGGYFGIFGQVRG